MIGSEVQLHAMRARLLPGRSTPTEDYTADRQYGVGPCMMEADRLVLRTRVGENTYNVTPLYQADAPVAPHLCMAITADASRGYFQLRTKDGFYTTYSIPTWGPGRWLQSWLKRPRVVIDQLISPLDAIAVRPDEGALAGACGEYVLQWPLRRGVREKGDCYRLPHRVEDVAYLPGDALGIRTSGPWHRQYFMLRPGDTAPQPVSLKALDETAWAHQLRLAVHGIEFLRGRPVEELERFFERRSWLMDGDDVARPHHAAATVDGRQVAVVVQDGSIGSVYIYSRESGEARRLGPCPVTTDCTITWSADGRHVIVSEPDAVTWVWPLKGDHPTALPSSGVRVTPLGAVFDTGRIAWEDVPARMSEPGFRDRMQPLLDRIASRATLGGSLPHSAGEVSIENDHVQLGPLTITRTSR